MTITVTIADADVLAALQRIRDALSDSGTTRLLNALGRDLKESTRLRFTDGQAPDGSTWQPLSPITRQLRRKGSGKPLSDTGRLKNSITMQVVGNTIEVGTNVCYAPVHQFGAMIRAQPGNPGSNRCGQRKGARFLVFGNEKAGFARLKAVNIPARPFLGISAADRETIFDTIRRHLGM